MLALMSPYKLYYSNKNIYLQAAKLLHRAQERIQKCYLFYHYLFFILLSQRIQKCYLFLSLSFFILLSQVNKSLPQDTKSFAQLRKAW